MARCGWVVGLMLLAMVASHVVSAQESDESVERDVPTTTNTATTAPTTAPTTRRSPATFPATRPFRRPATQLAPSKRPRSKPTTRPVKLDLNPSRVTLRLANVKADEVLQRFSKQTDAVFELSNDLWPQAAPRVGGKIEIVDQPFWPALREVFRITGTRLGESRRGFGLAGAPQEKGLISIAPQAGKGHGLDGIVAGPLLVQVNSAHRVSRVEMIAPDQVKRTVSLSMQLLVEPRFDAIPLYPPVRFESAEDDKGRAITYQAPPPMMMPGNPSNVPQATRPGFLDQPGMWRTGMMLNLPADDSRRIAKLKASAEFAVMTGAVEIQISDVLHVSGTDMRLSGGVRILIPEAVMLPGTNGQQEIELRFIAWKGDAAPESWEPLHRGFIHWAQRARLLSGDGEELTRGTRWGTTAGNFEDVIDVMTRVRASDGVAGRYKLIWTAPSSAKVMSVPFEVTDLELP